MKRYYLWADYSNSEKFKPMQIMASDGYATLQEAKHDQDRVTNDDTLYAAPLFQRVWIMKATEIKDEVTQ
jgi:hypothetical protein